MNARIFLAAVLFASWCEAAELVVHLPLKNDLLDHGPRALSVEDSGLVANKNGVAFFPGKEDWLEMPFIALNRRAFAISMWVKPTGTFRGYGLLEQKDSDQGSRFFHLMLRDGLRPYFGFYGNDLVAPVRLERGEWQHLVFQYAGGRQQIWINAQLICERRAPPYRGKAGKTWLGRSPRWFNVRSRDFEGFMSDFCIYYGAMGFEEIKALAAHAPIETLSAGRLAKSRGSGEGENAGATGGIAKSTVTEVSAAMVKPSAQPFLSIEGKVLTLRGTPGAIYAIGVSADLDHWEPLGTVTIGGDGKVEFIDEDAAQHERRFYRIESGAVK